MYLPGFSWLRLHRSPSTNPALSSAFFHSRQQIGVSISTGVDEIAVSFVAEAYSAAVGPTSAPVRTLGGLMLVPDRIAGQGKQLDLVLPTSNGTPAALVLDKAIEDIAARYGKAAARFEN